MGALTETGQIWFKALGVDAVALSGQRRCFCRPCLDWGERRSHLAGAANLGGLEPVHRQLTNSRHDECRCAAGVPVDEVFLRILDPDDGVGCLGSPVQRSGA